jgi:hypothetical protein
MDYMKALIGCLINWWRNKEKNKLENHLFFGDEKKKLFLKKMGNTPKAKEKKQFIQRSFDQGKFHIPIIRPFQIYSIKEKLKQRMMIHFGCKMHNQSNGNH